MAEFANRLIVKQLESFFGKVGKVIAIKKSHNVEMLDIFFLKGDGTYFWYSIADNYISTGDSFEKTSEDWKLFMRDIFGEEYLKKYAEQPDTNGFIDGITKDDVIKMLELGHYRISRIWEVEAFREGTRRFKLELINDSSDKIIGDIVISPYFDFCSTSFNRNENQIAINEEKLIRIFIHKFGMNYISYYVFFERKKHDDAIDEFTRKEDEKLRRIEAKMVSIWENN